MRLLVKIWLCAGCLLGIAEWSQARPTEPDTLMRALREAASPTNALIREAYANPATRPDAFGHSLSELSIGYRLQTEESRPRATGTSPRRARCGEMPVTGSGSVGT